MTAQDPDADVRRLSGRPCGTTTRPPGSSSSTLMLLRGRIVPWDRRAPHPLLVEWVEQQPASSRGRTLVVGSGLGDDAAFLAARGYRVIAFDISKSAIESARRRFPTSPVDFRVADLLNPPAEWRQRFDLVVETYTTSPCPCGCVRRWPSTWAASSRREARCWCWPPQASEMNSSTGRRGRSAAPILNPLQSRAWR